MSEPGNLVEDRTPNLTRSQLETKFPDFPWSLDEASSRFNHTREAYVSLSLPEISNLQDTPKRSIVDLLERRKAAHDRGESTMKVLEIPTELQTWAIEKMVLASKFWGASTNRSIYIERFLTDEEKARAEELEKIKLEDKENKETIWPEVVNVMMGEFRIDVENGKPKLISNAEGKLLIEAVNMVSNSKSTWIERRINGVLGKFPAKATAVELLLHSGEILRNPGLFENIFLVYYFAFWREKLKNEKAEQK